MVVISWGAEEHLPGSSWSNSLRNREPTTGWTGLSSPTCQPRRESHVPTKCSFTGADRSTRFPGERFSRLRAAVAQDPKAGCCGAKGGEEVEKWLVVYQGPLSRVSNIPLEVKGCPLTTKSFSYITCNGPPPATHWVEVTTRIHPMNRRWILSAQSSCRPLFFQRWSSWLRPWKPSWRRSPRRILSWWGSSACTRRRVPCAAQTSTCFCLMFTCFGTSRNWWFRNFAVTLSKAVIALAYSRRSRWANRMT